jgi:putative transposase
MTAGNNPIADRSKLDQAKRHILTDKNGIPISAFITSASTHDIKAVTNVIDNTVIKRKPSSSYFAKKKRTKHHHLCLDRAYSSKSIEKEIIKRGYVPHIPYKRKRGQQQQQNVKTSKKNNLYTKNKRWVVSERTNSWHNRFRKLFIRYERKMENYLGLVQLSSSIIIYRKIVLG